MSTISDALFSLSGATSGIDWGTMADTIIENDSKPITQWEEKQEKLELKIELYEEFSALFKTMQSSLTSLKLTSTYSAKATEFTPLDGASSNVGIVTATATADAAIAQYEIEVVQKAQAHRIASDRVDDASTALGLSGTFSVDVGTLGSVDVTVEASDSLASISSKINEAAAAWGSENETTALVSASLVDRRIVLTSGLTGADSAMTLTDGGGVLSSLGFLDSGSVKNELNVAQDAILKLDGLTVTRETNEITDLIDNVTLNVVGAGKVQLDITLDAQTAVEGLQAFTDSYNDLMEWINIRLSEETVEDPESDFERAWGLLHGDSTLWQAKSTLRNLITTPLNVSFASRTSDQIYRQFGPLSDSDTEAIIQEDSQFVLYHDGKQTTIDVSVTDTWDTLAAKINSSVDDATGEPMVLKATVSNGQLTLKGNKGVTVADPDNFLAKTGLRTYTQIGQVGITTTSDDYGKSGLLEFSTDDFMEALKDNPNQVAELATQLMAKFGTYIDQMVSSSTVEVGSTVTIEGKVANQISVWETEISNLDTRISDFEERLDIKKQRLLTQFAAAEVSLSTMTSQLEWLTSMTDSLSAMSGSS
ncbi:flagellar filament capping protein FliD [Aminirod propionatiphilus]|uniref:Flagellar filament capping protein FliD n=1 Tax=Aminirod propionatiphilus TaxID=3415223 RepID=A0ACD1DST2_9BACT|nr:flagellar filament capping protein FliD [Synergistota bacterium]